jgi:HK97 family phage major capsid protein
MIARARGERVEKVKKMRDLLDGAEIERRDLSRREKAEYQQLEQDVDRLELELRKNGGHFDPRLLGGSAPGAMRAGTDGEVEDVLGPEQRMTDWLAERRGVDAGEYGGERFSLGRVLTALVRHDRSFLNEVEQRALLEGTDAAGGFLLPELLSVEVIDRLRAKGRTFQAGVRVVPMLSNELNFARLTGGVTPAWKNEAAPISDQSMTFDRVTLAPKTLPLLVKISQELFDDLSPEASTVVEDEMLGALALELDRVILRGSGVSPEPKGVRNQSGITVQELGSGDGDDITYTDVAKAIASVRGENLEPNDVICSARSAGRFDQLVDADGQPLNPPPSVREIMPFLVSNVIPDDLTVGATTSCSEVYVAEWGQVLVGMRTNVRVGIRPLLERYADNLLVGLLCYLRADVAMRHGEAATVITGVK